jgi:hemoglobin/transferrin/lactoferrin receptor protein
MSVARIGCAFAALWLVAADIAVAQEQTTDETQSLDVEDMDPVVLNPISVTATRNPIEAYEYPGMVSVIGRPEIETMQPSSADDILQWVPNVWFTGGPRRTGETPSIRGFSGPDVIVLFDGARQNFYSGHDGRFYIDPSLIEEVEVLRGPASSLYGSGGTGGVIAFGTLDASDFLDPGETAGATVSGGYQTVNREPVGTVTGYATPVEGVDVLGSLTLRQSGSIELGNGEKLTNSDEDIVAGLAKASVAFADFHQIEGSYLGFNNDVQEPNNGQGLGSDDIVDKNIETGTFRVAYNYDNPADNLLNLDLVTYYTSFMADELRLDDLGSGPTGELLKRDVDTYGMRLDNRSRVMTSDDLSTIFTYGVEYYHDKQFGAAGSNDRDGVPNAEDEFYGVFAQAEVIWSEPFGSLPGDLLIIPGLRYDDYSISSSIAPENSHNEWSPRLGATYLPNDWLMVFANYAQAFRAPTFDELFLTGTHFEIPIPGFPTIVNSFVPNPDLVPQTTRTFEFGAGLTFDRVFERGDQFRIKGSHFTTWAENLISLSVIQPAPFVDCNPFIPGDCDGTTEAENVANAKLWGNEIEAYYENQRLLIGVGYSSLDGRDEDTNDYLGVLTPDKLMVTGAVKLPEFDSLVGWRMLAADSFDKVNDPSEVRGGYTVHDIFAAWQPSDGPLQPFRLDIGIDNIFDKSYTRVYTGAAEPGRNYMGLLSYTMQW